MNNNPESIRPTPITRRAFMSAAGGSAACALMGRRHTKAYAADATPNRSSRITLERHLGATRSIVDELNSHAADNYYLGTPYGTIGPGEFGPDPSRWDCWHPNGKPASNGESYMNCTGFVVAVFEACGANCDVVGSFVGATGYNVGGKANLSRWRHYLDAHASLRIRYESKEQLLASGTLQKGDLILAEPNDWSAPGADNHVMIFWGDSPDHDLVWHSAPAGDGIVSGRAPGNMISRITTKTADCYWMHVPLTNLIEVILSKCSADVSLSGAAGHNPAYSLEGATFSVFRTYRNGTLSDFITSFTTDSDGRAAIDLVPGETVWLKEDDPPLGFLPWDAPQQLTVGQDASYEATIEDVPCTVVVLLLKEDAETGPNAQGWGTLEGAVYELVDANGTIHRATTAWNEDLRNWTATFSGLPRGDARIRETTPPKGYLLDTSGDEGWHAVSLEPDSHADASVVKVGPYVESVVRGDILGAKFEGSTEDGSGASKTPLAGCEFALWLQDDGTLESKGYDIGPILDANSAPILDDAGAPCRGFFMGTITSHEDGRFTSRDLLDSWNPEDHRGMQVPDHALPYGTYTLVEMLCPDPSFALIEPIRNIEVRSQEQEIFLIVEDELIASPVKIRKTDAATGLPLLKQGTAIELLAQQADGSFAPVEFSDRYPSNETISSFVIGEDGFIWLPSKLPWGTYAIREVRSIPPYLLSEEPVFFTVDELHDWDDGDALEVILENEAATGAIEGMKKDGETSEGLGGALFEVRAAHEIKMPDGTVALEKNAIAGTAVTDANGKWTVAGLPLGDGFAVYEVREIASPSGYALDERVYTVGLSYVDESTPEVKYALETADAPTDLRIRKTDMESGEGIEGVEFAVYLAHDDGTEMPSDVEPVAVHKTDRDGCIRITGLDNDQTYIVRETSARSDLGYVASDDRAIRYLSPEGRWFATREAYESAEDWTCGETVLKLELENDFTKIAIYKVDGDLWQKMQENGAEDTGQHAVLEQAALLSGGAFMLLDENSDIVSPDGNPAEPRSEWALSKGEPKIFTHLAAGKRFTVQEVAPPAGYAQGPEVSFAVKETTEVQPVIVTNREDRGFPSTSDNARTAAIGLGLTAIGTAALATHARSRIRKRGPDVPRLDRIAPQTPLDTRREP